MSHAGRGWCCGYSPWRSSDALILRRGWPSRMRSKSRDIPLSVSVPVVGLHLETAIVHNDHRMDGQRLAGNPRPDIGIALQGIQRNALAEFVDLHRRAEDAFATARPKIDFVGSPFCLAAGSPGDRRPLDRKSLAERLDDHVEIALAGDTVFLDRSPYRHRCRRKHRSRHLPLGLDPKAQRQISVQASGFLGRSSPSSRQLSAGVRAVQPVVPREFAFAVSKPTNVLRRIIVQIV